VLSGDALTVPYDKDKVKGAPHVDAEAGHISKEEEADLYRYYGLDYSQSTSDSGLPAGESDLPAADVGDVSGRPETGESMTRSEELVNVDTEQRESGKARLRKYVVTEQVTQTVPVEHVRMSTEKVTAQEEVSEVSRSTVCLEMFGKPPRASQAVILRRP